LRIVRNKRARGRKLAVKKLLFSILSILVLVLNVTDVKSSFSSEGKWPAHWWDRYLGLYACWDERYGRTGDDSKDFPTININVTKEGLFLGGIRGVEKISKSGRKGYYSVPVLNLKMKRDGQISFEVGERALYAKPVGWKEKGKKQIGVSREKIIYVGKITYDEINLSCKGDGCQKRKIVFGRVLP